MSDQNPGPDRDPYAPPPAGDQPAPPPLAPGGAAPPPPPPPAYGVPAPGAAPQYAQPGYGAAPQNGPGTAALVLGILGLVSICCGIAVIMSIIAVVMGNRGKKLAAEGLATNGGAAQAGFVMGWIGIALAVVYVVWLVIAFASGNASYTFQT